MENHRLKKTIFIINGKGRSGKDTVCSIASTICKTRNVSSITPILNIARAGGWNGEKTDEARRLLSRLKETFTEFNDLSYKYCIEQVEKFYQSDARLMFIHVREPEEIARLKKKIGSDCQALLVRRKGVSDKIFENPSDDRVEEYEYDVVIENDGNIEGLRDSVSNLLKFYALK